LQSRILHKDQHIETRFGVCLRIVYSLSIDCHPKMAGLGHSFASPPAAMRRGDRS